MAKASMLGVRKKKELDTLIQTHGYEDYQWIDPKKIIVSQWVRMKCMFGCGGYGHRACCPPNVPSVSECERFFKEYTDGIVLHFEKAVKKPQDRYAWTKKVFANLSKLERDVFFAGFEKVFLLSVSGCNLCAECTGTRVECRNPRAARPAPEALAVDVYSTVRQFGFPIAPLSDYHETMNRYAILLVA